jgi:hypothetical protein
MEDCDISNIIGIGYGKTYETTIVFKPVECSGKWKSLFYFTGTFRIVVAGK